MNNANISKTFKSVAVQLSNTGGLSRLAEAICRAASYQYRPLSIERLDGRLVQPNEKHFVHGETIVFREFGIYNNDGVERPSDAIRASLFMKAQVKDG